MNLHQAKRLIKACCPNLQIKKIVANNEGWVYFIAEVNDEYMFRFPRFPEANRDLLYEIAILPHLSKALSLAIPQFEFICKNTKDYPWQFVGYSKIPGTPLTKPLLEATDPHRPAKQLGLFLTQLHNFPIDKALESKIPQFNSEQWQGFYKTFYQRVEKEVVPLLNSDIQRRITETWKAFLSKKKYFNFHSTVIHRDLGDIHILWDRKQERITGIIDWNDVAIGDPAFDFTGILSDYGEEFTKLVLTHYKRSTDATFLDRPRFYMKIGWCHNIFYAQMIEDQQLLQESVKNLEKEFAFSD